MAKYTLSSLYHKIERAEVSHSTLTNLLCDYAQPNKKIHDFVKNKDLISLSNGFYLFSPDKIKAPYSLEHISNLLYGPSYVSLESALSFYKLIPESVPHTTCVTTRKDKKIQTEIGNFIYEHMNIKKYPYGIQQQEQNSQTRFLIATPLKALLDYITLRLKPNHFKNDHDIQKFLTEDLRLDLDAFYTQTPFKDIIELKPYYQKNLAQNLILKHLQKEYR